jgi:hypothetical protein
LCHDLNNGRNYKKYEYVSILRILELLKKNNQFLYDIVDYKGEYEICNDSNCKRKHEKPGFHRGFSFKNNNFNDNNSKEILKILNENIFSFLVLFKYRNIIPEEDKKFLFSEEDIDRSKNNKMTNSLIIFLIYSNKLTFKDFKWDQINDKIDYINNNNYSEETNKWGKYIADYFNNENLSFHKFLQIFLNLYKFEQNIIFNEPIEYNGDKYVAINFNKFANTNINKLVNKLFQNTNIQMKNINNFTDSEYTSFYNSLSEFSPHNNNIFNIIIFFLLFLSTYFGVHYYFNKKFYGNKLEYLVLLSVFIYYNSMNERFKIEYLFFNYLIINVISILINFLLKNKKIFNKEYICISLITVIIYDIQWYFVSEKSKIFIEKLYKTMSNFHFVSLNFKELNCVYDTIDERGYHKDNHKFYNCIRENEYEKFSQAMNSLSI